MRSDLGKYTRLVSLNCQMCGVVFWRPPNEAKRNPKFCGIECRRKGQIGAFKGNKNPNWKPPHVCALCGKKTEKRARRRKYCGVDCFRKAIGQGWIKTDSDGNKYRGREDANQEAIVAALTANRCSVINTVGAGPGFPDLLVGANDEWILMEVKNKLTPYGKKGLTEHQKRFCSSWDGKIYLVHTPEDALVAAGIPGPWFGVGRPKSIGWAVNREKPAV